jgi:hypothetical protein
MTVAAARAVPSLGINLFQNSIWPKGLEIVAAGHGVRILDVVDGGEATNTNARISGGLY